MNTSAPCKASASVRHAVSAAKRSLYESIRAGRPLYTTPAVSHMMICSRRAPSPTRNCATAMSAAPTPLKTIRT